MKSNVFVALSLVVLIGCRSESKKADHENEVPDQVEQTTTPAPANENVPEDVNKPMVKETAPVTPAAVPALPITIGNSISGGSGCPQGSPAPKVSFDQATGLLNFAYDQVVANGDALVESRKVCISSLTFDIPAGQQLVVRTDDGAKVTGEASTAADGSSFSGFYYEAGEPLQAEFKPSLIPAGANQKLTLAIKADPLTASCQTSTIINFSLSARVAGSGTVRLKSAGPFRVQLIPCKAP
ncbi:DUF4360 domain-containing protein [Oligoflexus tunisiensis]|uniref:DUF4360 domain-containing protein n=1 Tax=Oligoflexus tunisiensis TaxID=708132 RepID=UPI00159F2DBD|nr:DUF4360 domain-containing protein [Oligoflexus tunisiensis]